MGELYTYNLTHLTLVDAEETVEFTQRAEHGDVGGGSFVLDDTAGTLALVGQKDFSYTESSCSFPLTFRGFMGSRVYERSEVAPRVTTARKIRVSVEDLNSMLGHRLIDASDGLRPAETVAARGAWLMASDYVAFDDNGRCTFPATDMDKADYRYQHAGDVLADMALASGGHNYHVNDWGSGPELTFRDDNASTADSSTLRISNVLSDASAVTLNPKTTGTLTRSPAKVISKLAYSFAKGTVVEELAATATTFNGERSGTASNANVKTAATASEEAEAMLWQLHTEEDVIECGVDAVTSAQINLVRAGMRIEAKFSHLNTEGYGSFTWFRVLERTVSPLVADAGLYSLDLKLSPQEAAVPEPECAEDATPSATYYPLGGSGNIPNVTPSPGVVYYWRAGVTYPTIPAPGHQGSWHFPQYSAGGLGTIDYMGDCAANRLLFMVVGNGTMEVQTESYGGTLRGVVLVIGGAGGTDVVVATGTSGDVLTYEVTDTSEGDCIRVIEMRDSTWPTCGSKVGWSEMVWTAA